MYIYENIAFRVIEKRDLEILRKLHNDPSTYMNILSLDWVDEENQLEWWKNLRNKTNDQRFSLCFAEKPDIVYGRLRIQSINHLHKNCEVGLDILPEYRGRGLGLQSYQMVIDYLFKQFGMHMIYLKVADFNKSALDLYKKVGFSETGRFPDFFFRNGKYHDYILMSIVASQET